MAFAWVALSAAGVTFVLSLRAGHDQLAASSRQRLVIGEAVLRSAVERHRYLPGVLAIDTEVRALLADPAASPRVGVSNTEFETIARISGADTVCLLDAKGVTLAASNRNQPSSFVGISCAYRPYFTDAVTRGTAQYFGVGTTTSRPGPFIGMAVPSASGGRAGIVVVRVDLEGLQGDWRRAGERVLFVDDEETVREAVEQWLTLAGHEVATFEAPEASLAEIDPHFPGILVSDMRMPRTDGLAVLEQALDRDPDLPVLLVTGHGDVAMAVTAMQRGAYDFIAKPLEPERLVDAMTCTTAWAWPNCASHRSASGGRTSRCCSSTSRAAPPKPTAERCAPVSGRPTRPGCGCPTPASTATSTATAGSEPERRPGAGLGLIACRSSRRPSRGRPQRRQLPRVVADARGHLAAALWPCRY